MNTTIKTETDRIAKVVPSQQASGDGNSAKASTRFSSAKTLCPARNGEAEEVVSPAYHSRGNRTRRHLPMQLFTGAVARSSRRNDSLLQNPAEYLMRGQRQLCSDMLARHIKPKKIVFHTRLVPHETGGMNRPKNPPKVRKFRRESHRDLREILRTQPLI